MIDLKATFEKHADEFLKFERVGIIARMSNRPDLCAFLLLDSIVAPSEYDVVSHAQYDEIWLCIDPDELAEKATEEQIVTLIRCGVRYSDDSLCMFV